MAVPVPDVANALEVALLLVLALDVVFVFIILFLEREDPTRTLQWLMALVLLPVFGILLFLVFHQNHRRKRRRFEAKARADLGIALPEKPPPRPSPAEVAATDAALGEFADLARLVSRSGGAGPAVTRGNAVRLFLDGRAKFDALLADVRGAREHVHLQTFILREDALGRAVLGALEERARAGVEVRLLVDAMGGRKLGRAVERLTAAGGRVVLFYPGVWHLNYRNHRKIAAIDGRVAYCGGFNVADEYVGRGPFGPWRDAAVRVEGPAAHLLQLRFLRDWLFASGEKVEDARRYFGPVRADGPAIVQEVSSGPDTERPWIAETCLKMIMEARETCYLQTPYFAPGEGLMAALRVAAGSGVDVRIMIPDRPDHPFVFWATQSFCADLLASGVRCFQYTAGFLHSKTLVVDGKVCSVGSANFDRRSFVLNFETNLLVYDRATADAVRRAFLADQERCVELTRRTYARRSAAVKAKEAVSRLFYPLA